MMKTLITEVSGRSWLDTQMASRAQAAATTHHPASLVPRARQAFRQKWGYFCVIKPELGYSETTD